MRARTALLGDWSRQKAVAASSSIACSSLKLMRVFRESLMVLTASILRQAEHALADDVGLMTTGARRSQFAE